MNRICQLLTWILSAQLSLNSTMTFAALGDYERSVPLRRLANAMLDEVAQRSMMVRTLKDYDRVFLSGLPLKDRLALLGKLQGFEKFSTFKRLGSSLIWDNGLRRLEITWPDPRTSTFEINGVKWVYNSREALLPQIERLKLKSLAPKNAYFIIQNLLPSAEAEPLITLTAIALMAIGALIGTIVGTALAGPVGDMRDYFWCGTVQKSGGTTKSCEDYQKSRKETALAKGPKFDAVSNQTATDKGNILSKYEGQDSKCPSENNGKDRQYSGRLRRVTLKDGKRVPTSPWINVLGKLNSKGMPTDFIFTTENVDPNSVNENSPDAINQLVVHVTFDPTEEKPVSYRFPSSDYGKKALADPTISLNVNMNLDAPQSQAIDEANDMVVFLNYRNYKCVEEKITSDLVAGVSSGSPVQPKPPESDVTPTIAH
jgi:hypothetical protein